MFKLDNQIKKSKIIKFIEIEDSFNKTLIDLEKIKMIYTPIKNVIDIVFSGSDEVLRLEYNNEEETTNSYEQLKNNLLYD